MGRITVGEFTEEIGKAVLEDDVKTAIKSTVREGIYQKISGDDFDFNELLKDVIVTTMDLRTSKV